MITVSSIVKFVLDNRHGKAFFEYNVDQIREDIQSGIAKLACVVDCDEQDNIFGIATGIPDYKKKSMHVKNILTIRQSSLKNLLKRFTEIYPTWTLTGLRKGKLRYYNNIDTFIKKVYGRSC